MIFAPLAEKMRPRSLSEFLGQKQILGEGTLLSRLLAEAAQKKNVRLPSLIFWGPPGTGKTTLSRLLAQHIDAHFETLSATSSGVKELRLVMEQAQSRLKIENKATLLFIDEIHRFNKSQQDALLPAVEEGVLTLVGATTENPSFELNRALLSRLRVFVLEALASEDIKTLLRRALSDVSRGVGGQELIVSEEILDLLSQMTAGDARAALNALEWIASQGEPNVSREMALEALQKSVIAYDAAGEEHYNMISALHKSVRASDPQAGLYYLARMIEGGEDPLYIARRLVRIASEDIGLADPQALVQALAAKEAVDFVGMPEADVALAQAVLYLSLAPKSVSVYEAIKKARTEVQSSGALPVPLNMRNAPTSLMKDLGYAKDYQYDPHQKGGVSQQPTLPEKMRGRQFYRPKDQAFERDLLKRMEYFERLRNEVRNTAKDGDL
jgi:putative ATPase